jgi:hypothetical protein
MISLLPFAIIISSALSWNNHLSVFKSSIRSLSAAAPPPKLPQKQLQQQTQQQTQQHRHFIWKQRSPSLCHSSRTSPIAVLSMSNYDDQTEQQHQQEGEDDTVEWKAVLAAFKMYKAAYGDLRIPLRFIVPSMPPWPSK